MILFLNTADFNQLTFALIDEDKIVLKRLPFEYSKSEKTLSFLEKFLVKNKFDFAKNKLEKIIVVSGPGSFSGIRTGVAMVLAFSMAHSIPIFAVTSDRLPKDLQEIQRWKNSKFKKIDAGFIPEYGAEPNITM